MTIIPIGANDGMSYDMARLLGALVAATTALFLMCGRLPAPYGRLARNAAVALYGLTFLGVLIYLGLWSFGVEF